jgi:hypothetical protein
MSHIRQQIIEGIEDLVTGLTTTGTNVFRGRVTPLETNTNLPCLIVKFSPGNESMGEQSMPAPRLQFRTIRIDVMGYTLGPDLDSNMNQIGLEVEQALAMPVTGEWKTITLEGTSLDYDDSGKEPMGRIVMTYACEYRVRENAPDTAA